MLRIFFLQIVLLFSTLEICAQFSISGSASYEYKTSLSGTGINSIFIQNGLQNTQLIYSSANNNIVKFYKYKSGDTTQTEILKDEISVTTDNDKSTFLINNLEDNYGYIAEVNGNTVSTVGILDYNLHKPIIESINIQEAENKCSTIKLLINKSDQLSFYTPSGRELQINRLYTLEYNTLEIENKELKPILNKYEGIRLSSEETVDAPYVDTKFSISDFIGESIGLNITAESEYYDAIAVKGFIEAEQINKEENPEELGGSAPSQITFRAVSNEPVSYYYTWFIYDNKNQTEAIARYMQKEFSYTFNNSGQYTVTLEVADRTSTCTDITSIEFTFDESKLEVPNYFSPGEGSNGEKTFRVLHKSLIKYQCSIFTSWGVKVFQSNDPSEGWNGKHNGKYVPTGVYYYVITAQGSDGKKYKKGGDLNILRKK